MIGIIDLKVSQPTGKIGANIYVSAGSGTVLSALLLDDCVLISGNHQEYNPRLRDHGIIMKLQIYPMKPSWWASSRLKMAYACVLCGAVA